MLIRQPGAMFLVQQRAHCVVVGGYLELLLHEECIAKAVALAIHELAPVAPPRSVSVLLPSETRVRTVLTVLPGQYLGKDNAGELTFDQEGAVGGLVADRRRQDGGLHPAALCLSSWPTPLVTHQIA